MRSTILLLCLSVGFLAPRPGSASEKRYEAFVVRGGSMEPTLQSGDQVLLDIEARPTRGSIVGVQFKNRKLPMIKRVVAVARDRAELHDERLWVNGTEVKTPGGEPYRVPASAAKKLSIQLSRYGHVVPSGAVILLGDNPAMSFDSTEYGLAYVSQVIGCAVPVINF